MFECMEISEYIHEGVVEPSYKQYTAAYATRTGCIRDNIGETTSSHIYSAMSESTGKHRKIYVDYPKG